MSKNFKSGLGSLIQNTESKPKKSTVRKSAQKGTKEGEARFSTIANIDDCEKLKAIAKIEGLAIKEVVAEAFKRFITEYEKKKGKIDLSVLEKKKIL